jgi:hypothetical protein
MKKLFILGLISLSMNAQGPATIEEEYNDKYGKNYNPSAAERLQANIDKQTREAGEKWQNQESINQENSKNFKKNTAFSIPINELYNAFFNSDYDGAGFSTQVDFDDDPWNKLAPDIFAYDLGLKSADLKPRRGGPSNWFRQLFGGQKLSPEQSFKKRLIKALIKKAINDLSTGIKRDDYVKIIKNLSNAFAKGDFDIKNININELYNDIVGKVTDKNTLNKPRIILANLNLILSLNSTQDDPDKSIKLSKAFESLYPSTVEFIFKAMKNLEINYDGTINPVPFNADDDTKIAKLILDQLPSVALKKALIELSKANFSKRIVGLDINDLVKQIIDKPNAKALEGPDGQLLIRFEANQGGTSEGGERAVDPTLTRIVIPHELSEGFEYDNPNGLPADE